MNQIIHSMHLAGREYAASLKACFDVSKGDGTVLKEITKALIKPTESLSSRFSSATSELMFIQPKLNSESIRVARLTLQGIRDVEYIYRDILFIEVKALRLIEFAVALAQLRGRVEEFWNISRQMAPITKTFRSDINPEALRALATHTTNRLIELTDKYD